MEASEVNGIYDVVIKIASDSLAKLKETITRDIYNNRYSQINNDTSGS
jgi:hypothetical protein